MSATSTPANLRLHFRQATTSDVTDIVRMLADDALGATREQYQDPLPECYFSAFNAITADPNNELTVACLGRDVVGVLQITFIPYLTHRGSWRALIEGVRIDSRYRSHGFGQSMFEWAIARAQQRGCHIVQLTTDKLRPDAKRFYESLGFEATHEGMKLKLEIPA